MNRETEKIWKALTAGRTVPSETASSLLRKIVQGEYRPAAFFHPLGFVYVPLLRRPGWSMRLHLWSSDGPRTPLTTSPYHMHTWDLISYVHTGRLANELVEVTAECQRPEYRVFDIFGDGSQSTLQPTDQLVKARVCGTEEVGAGELYGMPAERYHTTVNVGSEPLITVALMTYVPGTKERTLGPLTGAAHVVPREPCTPSELINAVDCALSVRS
jgi:hypothetical protein